MLKTHYYFDDKKTRGGAKKEITLFFDPINKLNKEHQKIFLLIKDCFANLNKRTEESDLFSFFYEKGFCEKIMRGILNVEKTKEYALSLGEQGKVSVISDFSIHINNFFNYPDSVTNVFISLISEVLNEYQKK